MHDGMILLLAAVPCWSHSFVIEILLGTVVGQWSGESQRLEIKFSGI